MVVRVDVSEERFPMRLLTDAHQQQSTVKTSGRPEGRHQFIAHYPLPLSTTEMGQAAL